MRIEVKQRNWLSSLLRSGTQQGIANSVIAANTNDIFWNFTDKFLASKSNDLQTVIRQCIDKFALEPFECWTECMERHLQIAWELERSSRTSFQNVLKLFLRHKLSNQKLASSETDCTSTASAGMLVGHLREAQTWDNWCWSQNISSPSLLFMLKFLPGYFE